MHRSQLADLLGTQPSQISPGQVSYNLRRLRAHGLITRLPGTHRYRITDTGGHHAMLLTHIHTRLLQPGLNRTGGRGVCRGRYRCGQVRHSEIPDPGGERSHRARASRLGRRATWG